MKCVCIAAILFLVAVARVHCQAAGDVRLVNGTDTNSLVGRVEIYNSGSWQTVCADAGLCTNFAKVVCRQQNFSINGAQVYGLALYGQGAGAVGFQNFVCTGNEANVSQCTSTTPSTCSHTMDAAVSCKPKSICYDIGGHEGCCVSGCYVGSPYGCWCDSSCHGFGDCCAGIENTCPSGGGSVPGTLPGSTPCTTLGDISFVNGVGSAGRIRICDSYRWKTVCNDTFDNNEARVACRSLGLSETNYTIYDVSQYGQGTEDIYAKNMTCTGSATDVDLRSCSGSDSCCGHHRDVGLSCQPACSPGQVRFVGGPSNMEGRVEVCNEGRWGTVCDDLWGVQDARVACKMAGFPWRGAVAYSGPTTANTYGSGFGPIWLDNLGCTGSENSLFNCSANAVGSHNCIHFEDAGAKCAPGPCELAGYTTTCCTPTDTNSCQGVDPTGVCHCSLDCEDHGDCCVDFPLICSCTDYQLRLRGGTVPNEGRVEMCYSGQWGTVCDDFWGTPDARVVCRQLGYATQGVQSFSFAYFGYGTGPIWLDNVHCSGTETHLVNCSSNAIGSHNCGHYEDAGVRCYVPGAPECVHGQARLVRGPNEYEGQLEVCYNGQWGTVCDDFFAQVDGNVACRTIFPSQPTGGARVIYYSYQYFGYSTRDIVMDNVQCTGSETNIVNCTHITSHNCYHYEDVGLACYPPATYSGQPQLVPGPSAGRLDVYTGSTWGPICRNGFGLEDARVVCRELGQPTGSPRVYRDLQFGRGYGSVKYTQVACVGNETHLNNCSKQTSGFYCSTYWSVGVGCDESCSNGQVRLVDGQNFTEGRVEVCRNGTWGTICDSPSSRTWATEEAVVVCKQLGLPYTAAQTKNFGRGADPIHYSGVDCDGGEGTLELCSRNANPSCTSHSYDVGVTCQESCNSGEVRLVDGSNMNEGRLEICIGGLWGTVCDNQFHNIDAQVVCKQLGLPYQGAEATYDAYFGQGTDHIAITSLYCTGSESDLLSCVFQTGSSVSCTHANDAGVICQDVCTNGALRLAASSTPNSGRVETCYHAEWSTICDKGWDFPDVQVACYQLGYERSPVRAYGGSKFGAGVGTIVFRDVGCTGAENTLAACNVNTNVDGCDHTDDAGLECDGSIRPPIATSVTATVMPTSTPIVLPPPGPVTNITLTPVNTTYYTLTWSPPDVTNGVIVNYIIILNNVVTNVAGNRPRQMIFSTLQPGVPYILSISASNVFGVGPPTTVLPSPFFTAELAPNTAVAVQGSRVDEHTLMISWTELTKDQARGTVDNYTIVWSVYDPAASPQIVGTVVVGAGQTSWTSTPTLVPSMQYSVAIAANTVGLGPYSTVIIPTTTSTFIQLKIAITGQTCGTWTAASPADKLSAVSTAVIREVKRRCTGCFFDEDNLANQRFRCNADTSEADQATYRAQVFAPDNIITNVTIIRYINQWLATTSPSVNIGGIDFPVDANCTLAISGFNDNLCTTTRPAVDTQIGASVGIGVGVTIGAVVVFAVMAVVLVFIVVFVRRTKIKYQAGDGGDVVGYSNRMAFPEGNEDNISQHMGSTVHDDDFQEALNMISDDIGDKSKLAQDEGHVYMNVK